MTRLGDNYVSLIFAFSVNSYSVFTANGMSPPRAPEQHHAASESKHDCMGTILCMLTCKDGYQLGQREENGCQTCTCKKKNGKATFTCIKSMYQ